MTRKVRLPKQWINEHKNHSPSFREVVGPLPYQTIKLPKPQYTPSGLIEETSLCNSVILFLLCGENFSLDHRVQQSQKSVWQ